jgi:large subunit ribosomal protein L32
MRRAHHALHLPTIGECPQCHNAKLTHRMCRTCGYYDGREVRPIEAAAEA